MIAGAGARTPMPALATQVQLASSRILIAGIQKLNGTNSPSQALYGIMVMHP